MQVIFFSQRFDMRKQKTNNRQQTTATTSSDETDSQFV